MIWFFRCDGSAQMGIGHLMRSQALAQGCEQWHIEPHFIIRAESLPICRARHDWQGKITLIPDSISIQDEPQWLAELYTQLSADALVLDGYQFSSDYRRQLADADVPLITFDDNNEHGQLYATVIINGSENAASLGYENTAPKAGLSVGSDYRVLRQEFVQQKTIPMEQRHGLTIVMGGSDPMNMTLPLAQALAETGFDAPIRIITGAAYPKLAELKDWIAAAPMAIQHIHDAQQIAELFAYSRLVVSAAGSSQFELCVTATPSLLVVVADNQLNATEQASLLGSSDFVDVRDSADFNALAQRVIGLWHDDEALTMMHQVCLTQRNLDGTNNIIRDSLRALNGSRKYD